MSTPTPEEAFLEYARSTGWDETAVRVVLDTVRKARHAAALEMRGRCARAVDDYDLDFKSPGCCWVAAQRTAERLADLVSSLEV